MAGLQSHISRAFDLQKVLTFCFALLTAAPLLAQPAGVETGIQPEQILAHEPESLQARFDAALLMVKLARPELGKRYLAEILAMNPSAADLIGLRNKFGTSTFLSLTNVDGLNPEAGHLLAKLNQAVSAQANDPGYVVSLLPKLAGSARERSQALTDLRALGPYAVPEMLKAIDARTVSRDLIVYNLMRLGDEAVPPMLGALTSPSDQVRSAAAEVLGWLGSEEDVTWLWHSAFSPDLPQGAQESARKSIAKIRYDDPRLVNRVTSYGVGSQLLAESIKYLKGSHQWGVRYEEMEHIPVWTWDASSGTVVETQTTRAHAGVHFAERLAREAAELNPTNQDAAIVLLAARMVRDIESAGWDQPVPTGPGTAHDLAVLAGPETCTQVLQLSMDNEIPGAARCAVTALGLNGSRSMLSHSGSRPVIVEALDFPHPRVQFAAAVTILEWQPLKSFPGSRRVVEILARAVQSGSKPDSVVIDPDVKRGTLTASLLSELGYDSSLVKTGMDGFRIAAQRGDVELAVLHPNTINWDLTRTIENLKADVRTQNLPLVIYGPAELRGRFTQIQSRFRNVVYVNESVSSLDISRELRPVLNQLSPPALTAAQRTSQMHAAAYWLRWIATSSDSTVFDLAPVQSSIMEATSTPAVADDTIVALGAIGTPAVQQRFLEFAEAPSYEMSVRQRSALQLSFSIQRFGVLLTPAELDRVVALSQGQASPELSTALASVLGSLKPKPEAVRKLVLDARQTTAPIALDAAAN